MGKSNQIYQHKPRTVFWFDPHTRILKNNKSERIYDILEILEIITSLSTVIQ